MLKLLAAGILVTAMASRTEAATCADFRFKEQCQDESPESLKCTWASKVPGDFDEANYGCQEQSCLTLADGEMMGDPKTLCTSIANCEWNEEVYTCVEKGKQPPCELFYADPESGEKCPTGCKYSDEIEKCIGVSETPPCDEVWDSEKCTADSKCQWHEDIYKCWGKGADIPCIEYEYMEQSNCPSTCKWIQTGHGSYDSEEGRCMEDGEEVSCEEIYEKDQCAADTNDRCKWIPSPMELCYPKNREVPCSRYMGKSCAESSACTWTSSGEYEEEGACTDCKTPGDASCVQKWTGPTDYGGGGAEYGGEDDGKACDTHTMNNCPIPRCFQQYDEDHDSAECGGAGSESGTCRDPQCADLEYDEDQCKKVDGCSYDADSGVCYSASGSSGGDFPCKNFYEQSECTGGIASGKCTWFKMQGEYEDSDMGVCYNTGKELACDEMDAYTKDACENGPQKAKCVWQEEIYECKAPNYEPPCISYDDAAECPTDRCEKVQGVCWEKGKELPCGALCSAFKCEASEACSWDQNFYKCSACKAGSDGTPDCGSDSKNAACNTFKSDETCPSGHCEFMYWDDNGSMEDDVGECTDKVCTAKYEKAECDATPKQGQKECIWTPGTYEGSGSCFPKGFATPCNLLYDEEKCRVGCDWDAGAYHCNEKGMPTPCAAYSDQDCPSRCDKEEYNCKHKPMDATVPNIDTVKQHGTGTGNQDEDQCTPSKYDALKGVLEEADAECVVVGRRERKDAHRKGRATDDQVKCLEYFLEQATPKSSISDACPCLWAWAQEIEIYQDHWMELNC